VTIEVELKFRLSDRAEIERKLAALGASAGSVQTQADEYFQHPCRDFAATDEALRIRASDSAVLISYKGPVLAGPAKARREIELGWADRVNVEQVQELLDCLGFQPVLTVRKIRRPYELEWRGQRFQVSVDDVPPLGTFVELEILAEEAEVSQARRAVGELAEQLQLESVVEQTYLELLQATVASPAIAEKNTQKPA